MENVWVAVRLGEPLSATIREKRLVEADCAMSGRQLKIPVFVASVALVGAVMSDHVSVWPGKSGSVAVFVKLIIAPATTVLLEIAVMTGAVFVLSLIHI